MSALSLEGRLSSIIELNLDQNQSGSIATKEGRQDRPTQVSPVLKEWLCE